MNIAIDIESFDRQLPFLIADSSTIQQGMVIDAPGGAKLHFQGGLIRKAVIFPR